MIRLDASPLLECVPPRRATRRHDKVTFRHLRGTNESSWEVRDYAGRPCRAPSLAEAAQVSRRTVHRWIKDGIPYWTADRVAIALGRHPVEVWPEWYGVDPEDDE